MSVSPAVPDGRGNALVRASADSAVVDWRAQDWEDLIPRLLLLAISRLRRMSWHGERRGAPPGAAEAEDFVNDAVSKTIAGIRIWNPAACSLFQHLAGVIVSDISHAAQSAENRATLRDGGPPMGGASLSTAVADAAPNQESVAAWRSEQRRLLDYLTAVDADIGRMAELMLIGDMQETADLSRALAIPPAEVANRRKRLKRAVQAYLAEGAS